MTNIIMMIILGWCIFFTPSAGSAQIVNPEEIYTYEKMTEDLQKINHVYPDVVTINPLGYSHFGRTIWGAKLGRGERNILMVGAHHGREWMTASLLMVMLEKYAEVFQNKGNYGPFSTTIFDEISIWFVPMLNPDGVTIQQQGFQAISPDERGQFFEMNGYSPDFSKWKANGMGVDLNRQYPAGWKNLKENVPIPWYQLYKGDIPLLAQEVQVLSAFTEKIKPLIAVSYHSSGREIFWKYKNGSNLEKDKRLAYKVSMLTGYKLGKPLKNAKGGGFTDWFISSFHKPAMTIEISPLVGETSPPLTIFPEEWERNELVGIFLATEAKKMAEVK
jgi:g-D-glutamyl-meso-diaminopimelate peptidase